VFPIPTQNHCCHDPNSDGDNYDDYCLSREPAVCFDHQQRLFILSGAAQYEQIVSGHFHRLAPGIVI
jgi:hypothetical protein